MGQWVGAQGQVKVSRKCKNTPTYDVPPSERQTKNKIFFFDVNKKNCWIRKGFEQLSSSSGWWFMAKKGQANIYSGSYGR